MKKIRIECTYTNGMTTSIEFSPTHTSCEDAVIEFTALQERKTAMLSNKTITKHLVRKSDIRPLRRFKLSVYWAENQILTSISNVPFKGSLMGDNEGLYATFKELAYESLQTVLNMPELEEAQGIEAQGINS